MLGGKCVQCGSSEELEFDHTDPSTKEFTISVMWSLAFDNQKLVDELKKVQLLCKTCHKVKSNREVPHGGGKYGKRYCKCELCKLKRREYMKTYKRYRV